MNYFFFRISAFTRLGDLRIVRFEDPKVQKPRGSKVLRIVRSRRFEKLKVGKFKFRKLKKTRDRKIQRSKTSNMLGARYLEIPLTREPRHSKIQE